MSVLLGTGVGLLTNVVTTSWNWRLVGALLAFVIGLTVLETWRHLQKVKRPADAAQPSPASRRVEHTWRPGLLGGLLITVVMIIAAIAVPAALYEGAYASGLINHTATAAPDSDYPEPPSGFAVYTNARFDFSIPYPELWILVSESDNSDGATIRPTDNTRVSLLAWGSWILSGADSAYSVPDHSTILLQSRLQVPHFDVDGQLVEMLDGRYTKYTKHGSPAMTYVEISVATEDRSFGILAGAPTRDFATYEPLFDAAISGYFIADD